MANTIVKSQLEDVKGFLDKTVVQIEDFLNDTTLSILKEENSEGDTEYNKSVLAGFRKLLVNCEEGLDACNVILQGDPFSKSAAEKTLYRIYYQCVEEFFSPKNDSWYEDSRSAYTGMNSIKFRKPVAERISKMVKGLEGEFQRIREELEYYETDYRTKMLQSK